MTSAYLQQWIQHPEMLNKDTLYEPSYVSGPVSLFPVTPVVISEEPLPAA